MRGFKLAEVLKRESDRLGAGFFLLTLSHDGRSEAPAEVFRKFVELRIAIDFNGLLGGVADHVAVVAPSQVVFQFSAGAGVEDAVKVVG
jgi:hypothetical protein